MDPVFNETVQIVEFDEGFDSEVFFMYVFLVAGLFLVLFLVYSLIGGSKGKKNVAVSKAMETGTTNDDVDYEWIPRSGNLIFPSNHIIVQISRWETGKRENKKGDYYKKKSRQQSTKKIIEAFIHCILNYNFSTEMITNSGFKI